MKEGLSSFISHNFLHFEGISANESKIGRGEESELKSHRGIGGFGLNHFIPNFTARSGKPTSTLDTPLTLVETPGCVTKRVHKEPP